MHSDIKTSFVFFGSDEFSIIVLEELKNAELVPALIVTMPDKPKGRGLKLTPPPIKLWAEENHIPVLQPQKLDVFFTSQLSGFNYQLFIVASYGKIIPKNILEIPRHGALNVHPSLLPLYRGPSPIQSQILDHASDPGVTIIFVDAEMDHGPIVATEKFNSDIKDMRYQELETALARLGGKTLARILPLWIRGEITPQEQEHEKTTYTHKIKKEDGLLNLNNNPEKNYRKFLAFGHHPGVYFFANDKRVKITNADFVEDEFKIRKVIPEGKKETEYKNFLRDIEKKTST